MHEHRERELKFEVPANWVVPDLSALLPEGGSLQSETVHLSSTYFDTAARDLLSRAITLRRRDGDADTGWHLKVPDGDARTELHMPLGDSDTVPAELQELVLGVRGGAELELAARIDTVRAIHRFRDAAGTAIAELADDRVTATVPGEAAVVQQWREVEIELVEGSERFLQRTARRLTKSGAYPASDASKLGRALDWATVQRLAPDSSLHALVDDYLDQQYRVIIRGDIDLRRNEPVIHATRVATRRYRSVLRVFAREFDADRAAALDGELAWYANLLGAVRDRQVLRTHLDAAVDALPPELVLGPVKARIAETLTRDERDATAALAAAMSDERYFALLRELRTWNDAPPFTRDDRLARSVESYVAASQRTLNRRLKQVRRAADPDQVRHRARKAGKRARYTAELAEPVLGKAAAKLVQRGKRIQDELGDAQDSVIAAEFLRREGANAAIAGENGFTFGLLWAQEQQRRRGRD